MLSYINDLCYKEVNDYINLLNNEKINNLETQAQFSNNLFGLEYYHNDYEFEQNNENIYRTLINNNYEESNDTLFKKNNFSNKVYHKNILNNTKARRISKSFISLQLEKYFKESPFRWSKTKRIEISIITSIPQKTIYKWLWNKLNKQN